jgi:transposase
MVLGACRSGDPGTLAARYRTARYLSALRGIDAIAAVSFLSEVGDLGRFTNPRQLMGYLGLTPSEASSGDDVRRGGITKAGNIRARRTPIESAGTYRFPARLGADKRAKIESLPKPVADIAWKAQVRLCARYGAQVAPCGSAPLNGFDRQGKEAGRCCHCCRPRAGRLPLGHRL